MVAELGWLSLAHRRALPVSLYDVPYKKQSDIPATYLTPLQHQLTRGNQMKYHRPHTGVTAYQQYFSPASIKLWNLTPADIVSSPMAHVMWTSMPHSNITSWWNPDHFVPLFTTKDFTRDTCLVCDAKFDNSREGEQWIQCQVCDNWAHLECSPLDA